MKSRLRLLTALNALFLLTVFGCGDEEGGCGSPPSKNEEQSSSGGMSGNTGSTPRGGDIIISDKKGRVPKPYQRPKSAYEPEKSTATISKPVIALSPAARRALSLPISRITKRRVDGVADRVEVKCRIMASSPDGNCSGAANYDEIKERCCPGGLIERCSATMSGVVLTGRGCEPAK